MSVQRRLFDAIIRHRIDLQRYSKREAAIVLELMGQGDAELVQLLRTRLPRVTPGRTGELHDEVRSMRRASFSRVGSRLGQDLGALARLEGAAMERFARTAVGAPVVFNPIRQAQLRHAVSAQIFGDGATGAGRTLEGWLATIADADKTRLFDAIDLGVRKRETVDDQVRRIAGTRAAGYADGVLAVSRRQAESLVRTATVHAANAAQKEWSKANADVVTGMEQVEVLDDATCSKCERLNGRIWDVREDDEAGQDAIVPVHLNCRGGLVPVLDLDALAEKVPDEIGEDEEAAA